MSVKQKFSWRWFHRVWDKKECGLVYLYSLVANFFGIPYLYIECCLVLFTCWYCYLFLVRYTAKL